MRLEIDGTFNLRDVGGLPVQGGGRLRCNLLYRSDAIDAISEAGRRSLRDLNLRTVIDLREPRERREAPPDLGNGVRCEQIPILRDRLTYGHLADIADLYAAVIGVAGPEFAAVIECLSRPDALPALVHCTAGKDRTGMAVGLLLAAIGVPDSAVADDYAVTEVNLGEEARARVLQRAIEAGIPAQQLAVMMGSPPQLMMDVLDQVRAANGTVAAYLTRHGLDTDALVRLRRTLVEFN
ncbi:MULTISPECIES: tyrosine-protein phosphatase [Mycobacterium]|uniref:tyrosine-protein phosphatase n=1 Tax=Mycobacterium TaxID=1763 RepID=UPI001EF155AD|nr:MULTISPECIES: tyrosine-protein phosphatase [Mycobacterium]